MTQLSESTPLGQAPTENIIRMDGGMSFGDIQPPLSDQQPDSRTLTRTIYDQHRGDPNGEYAPHIVTSAQD